MTKKANHVGNAAPWVATAAGMLVVACGVLVAFGVAFSRGWRGPSAQLVAIILPYPAAVVGTRPVFVRDVFADTDAFLAYQDANPEWKTTALSVEIIESNVLSRLVETARLETLAADRGIVVTDAEVDAEIADAKQNGTQLSDMLKQFDWSEEELKNKVIRVYLLQQKLRGVMGMDALEAAMADQSGVLYLMHR